MNHIKLSIEEAMKGGYLSLEAVARRLEIPLSHLKECLFSNENMNRLVFEVNYADGKKEYLILPHHVNLIKTFKDSVKNQYYLTAHGTYLSPSAFMEYACLDGEESLSQFIKDAEMYANFPLLWKKITSIYEQPPEDSYSLEVANEVMKWNVRKKGILSLYYHRILNDMQPIFADDPRYRINSNVRPDIFGS